jgi:hypothetical protein
MLTSARGAPALGRDTDEILRTFDLDSPEVK